MVESSSKDTRPGTVCTFYSYKGGVGRSMALANVGAVMAMEGHRVLLVDWDLEAPGLEVYFRRGAHLNGDPSTKAGIVDLLEARTRNEPLSWTQCLLKAKFFGRSLDIITAGSRTDDYRRRVQQFNWEDLFNKYRIGNYINSLREEWRAAYDFVLIDSRTGITDIGDICTVLLPDILVLMFVANSQNVEGIKDAMARTIESRSKLPVNRSKLLGVPIPARDERDREYDKSVEWQRTFAASFGEMYREWLPKEVEPADALNKLYIPYVAAWSFGESIPVIESDRERSDPSSIGAAYTRLATLLLHRLDWYAIEGKASVGELVGTRVELSKAREEKLAAQVLAATTVRRARIWVAAIVFIFLGGAVGGVMWYQNRPEPISTDLFVGDRLRDGGNLAGSLEVYEARRKSLEQSAAKAPLDNEVQRELFISLMRIGTTHRLLGNFGEALGSQQAAKTVIEKLVAGSPAEPGYLGDLGVVYIEIGRVLEAQGKLTEALISYEASKAINDKLATASPENPTRQVNLIRSDVQIGSVLAAQGNLAVALVSYQAAKARAEKLLADRPENTDYQDELALIHSWIGDALDLQGKLPEALASYQAYQVILKKLLTEEPSNNDWQLGLSVSHNRIGRVLQAQGKLTEAQASFQADKAIKERLVATTPENAELQRYLSSTLKFIGRLMLEMHQPEEALRNLDLAAEISSRQRVAAFAVARLDMVEIQRFRIDALLMLDNLKSAREACRQGKGTASPTALGVTVHELWEPSLTALDMACAEVSAREGDLSGAYKEMAAASVRLSELAASSDKAELRRESLRADKRTAELSRALAPVEK